MNNLLIAELEEEPYHEVITGVVSFTVNPFTLELLIALLAIGILLIFSGLVSGSEAAFFSLSPEELNSIKKNKTKRNQVIERLLHMPEKLLATILVVNNLINIAIIVIAAYFSSSLFDFTNAEVLGFFIEVVSLTFIIVFFGEILPKIYAIRYSDKMARLMAIPLEFAELICRPVNFMLINFSNIINKKMSKPTNTISMDDLSEALDLTDKGISEEKKILEGIVKLGNINVSEVMTPRVDVVGVSVNTRFKKLCTVVINSGYSRIPVYSKNLDDIKGVLFIKDLLPFLGKPDSFKWQSLLRVANYVPETKKINDLLQEFQTTKNHMAIVIDEYGGTSGVITLEDILEEIVGEITDESDQEEASYVKIDEYNYLFEGKTAINDFLKIFNLDEEIFDDIKGDADTLAGLILESRGELPARNEIFHYKDFEFTVKSVDKRRIKQIKVTLLPNTGINET